MNVDLMRKIDYFVGVPLTFFSSTVFKLLDLANPCKPVPVKNTLLIELSEMGSTILVDPAMQKLKKTFDAKLFFVIFSKNKDSLLLLNTVPEENIFALREDNLLTLVIDVFRFLLWTRKHHIDTVIDLELFSRVTALLSAFSGATNRVGFHAFFNEGLYRGNMMTHNVAYNAHQHIAKNFVALVNALIVEDKQVPYAKTLVTDDEIKLNKAIIDKTTQLAVINKIKLMYPHWVQHQKIILVNPNASELLPQRRWPVQNFVRLCEDLLAAYPETIILLTGAPSEQVEAEALKNQVGNERCINFAGQVKFLQLPALYSIAELMITNDSGPGHFSAVTEMPSIVLFGPETPALYGSLGNSIALFAGLSCSPCVSAANHRETPCTDNLCLQKILPEQVMDAVKKTLS